MEVDLIHFAKWLVAKDSTTNTVKVYVQTVRRFQVWLAGRDPTLDVVEDWFAMLADEGNRNSSLHRHLSAIRALFRFLDESNSHPLAGFTLPEETQEEPIILPVESIMEILEATVDLMYKAAFALQYGTGFKLSDMMKMKRGSIGKTMVHQNDTEITVDPDILAMVHTYLKLKYPGGDEDDRLFRFRYESFNTTLKLVCQGLELPPITSRGLRRSWAEHITDQGADVKMLMVMRRNPAIGRIRTHLKLSGV